MPTIKHFIGYVSYTHVIEDFDTNFITVDGFASYHNISLETARRLLQRSALQCNRANDMEILDRTGKVWLV